MLLVVVVGGIEVPCTLPSILRERSLLFYWLKLVQGQPGEMVTNCHCSQSDDCALPAPATPFKLQNCITFVFIGISRLFSLPLALKDSADIIDDNLCFRNTRKATL